MELGQHRTGAQDLASLLWLPAGTHDPRNAAQAAHAGGAMGAPRPVDRGIRSQHGYGCGGALGSNSGITRPSTSVKPYSFASSAASGSRYTKSARVRLRRRVRIEQWNYATVDIGEAVLFRQFRGQRIEVYEVSTGTVAAAR